MRVILFTGKGGVGKTTAAASAAVSAARQGARTLVMSTDAAHSLGDCLGHDLAGQTSPVPVEPRLHALQVDSSRSVGRAWQVVQEYLQTLLERLGGDPVVVQEMTSLPGADEIAAIVALRQHHELGEWDLIAVDCAPSAEALRLLALPEALGWHLQRWRSRGRTSRHAAALGLPVPPAEVLDVLGSWERELADIRGLLTAPTSSVRLVTTTEQVVIAEARRMWTLLRLYGFVVDAVIVNRIFPEGPGWLESWNRAQAIGLQAIRDSFAGIPILTAPYLPQEPIGPEALANFASGVEGAPSTINELLGPVAASGFELIPEADGYALSLPLPLVTARDLELGRRGDDLVIAVEGHRRIISLPRALQGLDVSSARLHGGALHISFGR